MTDRDAWPDTTEKSTRSVTRFAAARLPHRLDSLLHDLLNYVRGLRPFPELEDTGPEVA